ncbi:uncharacterized protein BT62DRAFT_959948 [Guyanagaster necrorhizus]|uniref:Uncharacterized protein n=1 Tax=Guyanagaster necrorhizus TaxID=856835 RepID=A0A9P7W667_9AGAR|nr:uncharacterized protein BT62DRAFT_959948 [Guyanagaster necrorhizus MCA 3950]KAG7451991.1 hypothetical protein BT62DRAFT_959948 [Guyanagaster necrorhizus MCA 3950]
MGRPSGRLPPIDLHYWNPDPDTEVPIHIMVTRISGFTDLRDLHWKLVWAVKTVEKDKDVQIFHRRLEVVQEIGFNHLTNWGAVTQVETTSSKRFNPRKVITTMNLAQRKELEKIAARVRVEEPDGVWNCQDWIVTVLQQAEQAGLITKNEWTAAVTWAKNGGEE